MRLPTRKQCYELFKKYKTPGNVIRHCEVANKIAVIIAKKLQERGVKVDAGLVDAASLLHDISRLEENHAEEGARIIAKEGYAEVAELIRKHRLSTIKKGLKGWEEKVVYYADKRVNNEIVSVEERVDEWAKRYPKYEKAIRGTLQLIKALEGEILGKTGLKPEQIKEMVG